MKYKVYNSYKTGESSTMEESYTIEADYFQIDNNSNLTFWLRDPDLYLNDKLVTAFSAGSWDNVLPLKEE
jgi:hypothetical protein